MSERSDEDDRPDIIVRMGGLEVRGKLIMVTHDHGGDPRAVSMPLTVRKVIAIPPAVSVKL